MDHKKINIRKNMADYGKHFGGFLVRIGKENFDMEYHEKKKRGDNKYIPLNPIPKFFVRRDVLTSIDLKDDPATGIKMMMFNKDTKLCVPCTHPLHPATSDALYDVINGCSSQEELDKAFFEDEESIVDFVEQLNKNTIMAVENQIRELMAAQNGLKAINSAERATYEANRIND